MVDRIDKKTFARAPGWLELEEPGEREREHGAGYFEIPVALKVTKLQLSWFCDAVTPEAAASVPRVAWVGSGPSPKQNLPANGFEFWGVHRMHLQKCLSE